jgi:hypothetical protein
MWIMSDRGVELMTKKKLCLHSSIDWKSCMCRDCYEVFEEEDDG